MTKQLARERSVIAGAWISEHLSDVPLHGNGQHDHIAQALFDLVIEHHAGIICLYDFHLLGPMFASARSLQECFVRGLWMRYGATENYSSEDQVKAFKKARLPTYGVMIGVVEKKMAVDSPSVLGRMKRSTWKYLSDFTHGGFQHVTRRFKPNGDLEPDYPESEIVQIIEYSGALALMAGCELASMVSDELAMKFLERSKEFSNARIKTAAG